MRLSSMTASASLAVAECPRPWLALRPRSAHMFDHPLPSAEEIARHRDQLALILRGSAVRQKAARAEARRMREVRGDGDDDRRYDYRLAAVIRALRLRREMHEVAEAFWRRRIEDPAIARAQTAISYAAALAV